MTDSPETSRVHAVFQRRPRSLAVDLRRSWRLPLVLLIVDACRAHQATRTQIHVLSWALLRRELRERMPDLLLTDAPDRSLLRFDPALARAIDLGVGCGYLSQTRTGALVATPQGQAIVDQLAADEAALAAEKHALARLPRRFTQRDAARLLHAAVPG